MQTLEQNSLSGSYMKKTPQSSTKKRKVITKQRPWEEYYDIFTFSMKPYNEETIAIVAQDLRNWAQQDGDDNFAFRIADFIDSRGLCWDTFYKWVKNNEGMKRAHAFAMRRLASRREKGAATRRFDSGTIFRSLAHYCEIEETQSDRRAALAQKNQQVQGPLHIHMDSIPNSELVPTRKNK